VKSKEKETEQTVTWSLTIEGVPLSVKMNFILEAERKNCNLRDVVKQCLIEYSEKMDKGGK
jgi:hypothetical protein